MPEDAHGVEIGAVALPHRGGRAQVGKGSSGTQWAMRESSASQSRFSMCVLAVNFPQQSLITSLSGLCGVGSSGPGWAEPSHGGHSSRAE